jgi:nucleoside-diphosphate-sugar epimerase
MCHRQPGCLVSPGDRAGDRPPAKTEALRALGARAVVADALDPDAVARAVAETEPEVIVHQLTALSGAMDLRHPERFFAMTNRLRTEGIDHLLAAGRAVGIRRFIAQSNACPGTYARTGGPVKAEDDPLDPDPPAKLRAAFDAIRYLEEAVTGIDWAEGIVLRYGGFYGPGTSLSADPEAETTKGIRKRTSRTRPAPPWRRSTAVGPASTTSSTTSRRRCASGCRSWPSNSAPASR